MTFSSFVGVCLTLALVLGLLAITMRVLRKVTQGGIGVRSPGAVNLEVVQRISLGPRQGIAVVRIADQLVAVSVGEGGVRQILELEQVPSELPEVVTAVSNGASHASRDFKSALMHGLRSAGLPLVMALSVVSTLSPSRAHAQNATGAAGAPASAQQRPAPGATTARPAVPAPNAGNAIGATLQQQRAAALQSATQAVGARPSGVAQGAAQTTAAGAPATARIAKPNAAQPAQSASLDQALQKAMPQLQLSLDNKNADGGLRLSGSVGVVIMLGLLTLLPTLVLMMTGFTRILIVLHFLKQALGTQTAPPAQLISALALLLTGFVMAPTMTEMNRTAITPWLDGKIEQGEMMKNALVPLREFMLRQTRERDIGAFVEMSGTAAPARPEDVSTIVLTSAFVTSELRTAFQLGFVLFLPFIVIDIVVSSVLMSMGMFMLPPAMISLPFKLLLFVLVDGWSLLVQSLVQGFH